MDLIDLLCPNCRGTFILQKDGSYVCDHCMAKSFDAGKDLGQNNIEKLNNANAQRDNYDFEESLRLCKEILKEKPKDAEANRCAILSEFKIIYLKNRKGEFAPTFLDPETPNPITRSEYYARLPENMRREMDRIEEMRKQVCAEYKTLPDYDVFLCYKRTVTGTTLTTPETEWAEELERFLSAKNLKVFLDKKSLKGNAGWEPHIYSALRSAKILIVLGSSAENMQSDWVKNEWKRFTYFRRRDKNKTIAVVCDSKVVLDDLDPILRYGQIITLGETKNNWKEELYRDRVKPACETSTDVSALIVKAQIAIANRKFKKAWRVLEEIECREQRNARCQWLKLMCLYKAMDNYDIVISKKEVGGLAEFRQAVEYGTQSEKEEFKSVQLAQYDRNTTGFERTNYNKYHMRTRGKRKFIRVSAICLALIAALSISVLVVGKNFSLKFSENGDGEILNGRNFLYDVFNHELIVKEHNSVRVTAIKENAFSNSKLKKIQLKNVVTIGNSAFENSAELKEASIQGEEVVIGERAFYGCEKLSKFEFSADTDAARAVSFGEGGIKIGDEAFSGCVSLEEIDLKHCVSLGSSVFSGCTSLKSVTINADANISFRDDCFSGVSNLTVRVPTVAKKLIAHLSGAGVNVETFVRSPIEECEEYISKLETIGPESRSDIDTAWQSYERLEPLQKQEVSNFALLENAEELYNLSVKIENLKEISSESGNKIEEAEAALKKLAGQQSRLLNLEKLQDARSLFDVINAIENLNDITPESEEAISKAEQLYEELEERLKGGVSNLEKLSECRAILNLMNYIHTLGDVRFGFEGREAVVIDSTNLNLLNDRKWREEAVSATLQGYSELDSEIWASAFPKISLINFDLSGYSPRGEITIPCGKVEYRFIGAVEKEYAFSVKISQGENASIGFENIKMLTGKSPAVEASSVSSVKISFAGQCEMRSTAAGTAGIVANGLEIVLAEDCNVLIVGADGADELGGGDGIFAKNAIFGGAMSGEMKVIGGNGVDGKDGANGTNGENGSKDPGNDEDRVAHSGEAGHNGENGHCGSDGGAAVFANSLKIQAGNYTFTGGNGGNGGSGGNGGDGGIGAGGFMYGLNYRWAGHGGNGGNGGNGGDGGKGGNAVEISDSSKGGITLLGGRIEFDPGCGGNGGHGGRGGNGGKGANDDWWTLHSGSNGGNGGRGGNGGSVYRGQSRSEISAMLKNSGGVVSYAEEKDDPVVGTGEEGGLGGEFGKNVNRVGGSGKGEPGQPGENGSKGTILDESGI